VLLSASFLFLQSIFPHIRSVEPEYTGAEEKLNPCTKMAVNTQFLSCKTLQNPFKTILKNPLKPLQRLLEDLKIVSIAFSMIFSLHGVVKLYLKKKVVKKVKKDLAV
jgi:hypothetical protein